MSGTLALAVGAITSQSALRKTRKPLAGTIASGASYLAQAVNQAEGLPASANATAGLGETFTDGPGPIAPLLKKILGAILRPVLRG